ncbi:unnamed protein product [Bursaphelenchus xylophilus]|uniref:(pine wood nematode) hypothetical protein n=1 Tax=Bursaphelenchus xylophilus TaxID=6326 RepID=A0A1I7S9Z8_BURXY|nr:unnamed protein product [Bursaphelenchus xylophilus]CAG9126113.1 unnamed protein product [Bursaphelenchus xylophilus]
MIHFRPVKHNPFHIALDTVPFLAWGKKLSCPSCPSQMHSKIVAVCLQRLLSRQDEHLFCRRTPICSRFLLPPIFSHRIRTERKSAHPILLFSVFAAWMAPHFRPPNTVVISPSSGLMTTAAAAPLDNTHSGDTSSSSPTTWEVLRWLRLHGRGGLQRPQRTHCLTRNGFVAGREDHVADRCVMTLFLLDFRMSSTPFFVHLARTIQTTSQFP